MLWAIGDGLPVGDPVGRAIALQKSLDCAREESITGLLHDLRSFRTLREAS